MQNTVKHAILERCKSIAIAFLGAALFISAAEHSSRAYGQDANPPDVKVGEKDGGEEKKGGDGLFGGPLGMMPLLIIMVLFFFFIILPAQRRQKKEQESVLANLKKNDEVVTSGGIIGIVWLIKETEDEVTLKIDENARIKVLKSSIVRIRNKEEPKDGVAAMPVAGTPPSTSIKP
jgi:preprotein translocase subunit YajC